MRLSDSQVSQNSDNLLNLIEVLRADLGGVLDDLLDPGNGGTTLQLHELISGDFHIAVGNIEFVVFDSPS